MGRRAQLAGRRTQLAARISGTSCTGQLAGRRTQLAARMSEPEFHIIEQWIRHLIIIMTSEYNIFRAK